MDSDSSRKLNIRRPIIILYDERMFNTMYLTLIVFTLTPIINFLLMDMYHLVPTLLRTILGRL